MKSVQIRTVLLRECTVGWKKICSEKLRINGDPGN